MSKIPHCGVSLLRNNRPKSILKGGQHPPEWQLFLAAYFDKKPPVLGGQLAPDYPEVVREQVGQIFGVVYVNI